MVAAAVIALCAVGVALSRPGRTVDDAGAASSPARATDAAVPAEPEGESGVVSRISRAPFVDPVEPAAAGPVDPGDDDPAAPVPAHLRRVVITLVFDDGTPLAGIRTNAEFSEERPAVDGRGTASTDDGAIVRGTTTSAGRVSFLIPRAAQVRVSVLGSDRYPPFRSEWFGPDVAETRAVLAAVPVRLTVVDDAERPVPGLEFFADGCSPVGGGIAKATTDADGRTVFRGFAPEKALLIGLDRAGVCYTRDCDRFAVTAVLGGAPYDPQSTEEFAAAPPADLKVTVRRLLFVGARVVDPTGKPVPGATVGVSLVIAGSAPPIEFEPGYTNGDGRFSRPLPLNGKGVGLDAMMVEVGFAVVTPDGRGTYVAVRPGPSPGGNLDAGDIVVPAVPAVRLLEFRIADESGKPVVGARMVAVGQDGLPDFSRRIVASEVDGRLVYPARPDDVRFFLRRG